MFPGVVRRIFKLVPTLLQAVALVVILHMVGQGLIQRYGSAKYRFSRSYQQALSGLGGSSSNKVQKVIKYIDKNVPRYSPKGGKLGSTTASTTSTTPAPPPPLTQLRAEQNKRLANLADVCTRYNIGNYKTNTTGKEVSSEVQEFLKKANLPPRPVWQNLICSQEQKLSLCPVYKAASTFLLKKFLLIAPSGKYDKNSVKHLDTNANILARKEFGYLKGWDLYPEFTTNGVTIIFVRHPFERILSAFRDKLEDPKIKGGSFNEYYYNKYGRRVVRYYRVDKVTGPSYKYPRFHEFVNYLLDKDMRYDDEHWTPFYRSCTPCNLDYSFIGKFETLYWDIHLLSNKVNLTEKWDDPKDYFQSSTYLQVSKEYFGLLERDTIRKLFDRYKLDFEMFGYSPDQYIAMGKPSADDIAKEEAKKEQERKIEEAKKVEALRIEAAARREEAVIKEELERKGKEELAKIEQHDKVEERRQDINQELVKDLNQPNLDTDRTALSETLEEIEPINNVSV